MDDLKNADKWGKARPRLRKIFDILADTGRGPAAITSTTTLELLMDPPGHTRATNHDAEIIRRAVYLNGRAGGPLTLISGDYTMLGLAAVEDLDCKITPTELLVLDTSEHPSEPPP